MSTETKAQPVWLPWNGTRDLPPEGPVWILDGNGHKWCSPSRNVAWLVSRGEIRSIAAWAPYLESDLPPIDPPQSRTIPPPAYDPDSVAFKPSGGGKLSGDHYYRVKVAEPIAPDVAPYTAECADISEALNLTFNEGEAFKAIWRLGAGRQGKAKNEPQYDADKAAHYGARIAACVRKASPKNID